MTDTSAPAAVAAVLEQAVSRYAGLRPNSRALSERLAGSLPAGETRSVATFQPFPVAIERGEGATLVDVDGLRYVDVLNNYTALVHGHAPPAVTAALHAVVDEGTAHPAPHRRLAELAEHIVARLPAAERVRFTNSGTEAAILALRIARRATGRRRLLLFDGGYHGTAPPFVDDAAGDVVRVPYNDPAALAAALDDTVAAVFAEPFLGSAGVIPAADGFLDLVGRQARDAGAVFVVDEVQSLRNAPGGQHAELTTPPDLVLLGKIIGGGLPVGAVAGRADLLLLTVESRGGFAHSGTFNGNPAVAAAGLASLEALDGSAIAALNARAGRLAAATEAAGAESGVPVTVTRAGSIMHVHLAAHAPVDAATARASAGPAVAALHLLLLGEGVYAAPRGMLNLSTAMTDADLEVVAAGYRRALKTLAGA